MAMAVFEQLSYLFSDCRLFFFVTKVRKAVWCVKGTVSEPRQKPYMETQPQDEKKSFWWLLISVKQHGTDGPEWWEIDLWTAF